MSRRGILSPNGDGVTVYIDTEVLTLEWVVGPPNTGRVDGRTAHVIT